MMFGVRVRLGRCRGPCPQPDVKPSASRRYRIFSFATALLDGIYARVVGNLADRIAARIRARGPITFADYMETALFDPEDGYYTARASLGFEGDYVTSVDLGPAFGRSLARGRAPGMASGRSTSGRKAERSSRSSVRRAVRICDGAFPNPCRSAAAGRRAPRPRVGSRASPRPSSRDTSC